ncbi:MAG: GHKL domain-containing protein, partial [Bacteroidia bacterium]|nr:GHKL domain-containing protein [Bacteroidia bacterium]
PCTADWKIWSFKNFRLNIIGRVLLLNFNILAILWLAIETTYYITMLSLLVLVGLQISSLIHYAERSTHMFARFLNAIRYDDFSQSYNTRGLGRAFDKLNLEFNQVMQKFLEIRAEKEAQYHYLRSIVQHIATGLLVYNERGEVQLLNNAAKRLLNIHHLAHVNQLRKKYEALSRYVDQAESQERELIRIQDIDQILHLAVRKTSIKLMEDRFYIISIQDIQSELEEKEMEAWQNLIRVLTHEIINTVTPIASLASTINDDLGHHIGQLPDLEHHLEGKRYFFLPAEDFGETVEEVHYAIKTIQRRSEGLIRFVRDFRSLTKVPMPNLQTFALKELLDSIILLEKEEFRQHQIQFSTDIKPQNIQLIADPQLLEQVLVNLLKNALQALEGREDKTIEFRAFQDNSGKTVIQLRDNGCGISEEAMKNIFVPFFTTKKTGSGIGLSLSRQIMRLHGGSISVKSKLGEGTMFSLRFP